MPAIGFPYAYCPPGSDHGGDSSTNSPWKFQHFQGESCDFPARGDALQNPLVAINSLSESETRRDLQQATFGLIASILTETEDSHVGIAILIECQGRGSIE